MKGAVLRRQMERKGGEKRRLRMNFRFLKQDATDTEEGELISHREKTEITAFLESENLEDGRETKASYDSFKMIESHIALNHLITIGLVIMQYDLEFEEKDSDISEVLLYLIFVLTLFQIVLTFFRYIRKTQFYILRRTYTYGSTIWSTGEYKKMFLEMLFLFIHPSPFLYNIKIDGFKNEFLDYNIYYHLNDLLGIFVIARVFFIARALAKYTYWTSNRSQRVCQLYDSQASVIFAIKCYIKANPFVVAFGLYISSIPILAYFLRICERPNIRTVEFAAHWSFNEFYDAMWDVVITIGTIGFGDYSPQTLPGRFFTFFICIWGSSVTSLIVVATNQKFDMAGFDLKIYRLLKRLKIREKMKKESAFVMTNLACAKFARGKGKPFQNNLHKVTHHLQRFRFHNRLYKELSEIDNDTERLNEQMGWLRSEMSDLIYYTKQLKTASLMFMNVLGVDGVVSEKMGSDFSVVRNSMLRSSLLKYTPSFCGGGGPEFEAKEKQIPF